MRGIGVPVALLVLLAVAAAAAACGGDGKSVTLEQYFEQVAAFETGVAGDLDELQVEFPDAFEDVEQTQSFLDSGAGVIRDRLAGLEETEPPKEVESAHKAYVDAVAGLADSFQDYADQLASESPPEMGDVLGGVQEAGGPLDVACSALQTIADGAGIEVDLNC
jgi:hypothetical protein